MAQKNRGMDKSLIFLFLGLFMAAVTGYLIVEGQSYYNKMVEVVCAAEEDIPAYTVIKETSLQIVKIPAVDVISNNTFPKKEDVVGKVSKSIIAKNSIIYKSEIIDSKKDSNMLATKLTELKDKSLVAYTIPTNQILSSGGKIMVNDRVHIIATLNVANPATGAKQYTSKILVPYARVLDTVGKDSTIKGITFALKTQEILDIEYALKNGTISFGLLPYKYDENIDEKTGTTEETFYSRHFQQ